MLCTNPSHTYPEILEMKLKCSVVLKNMNMKLLQHFIGSLKQNLEKIPPDSTKTEVRNLESPPHNLDSFIHLDCRLNLQCVKIAVKQCICLY